MLIAKRSIHRSRLDIGALQRRWEKTNSKKISRVLPTLISQSETNKLLFYRN